MSTTKAKNYYLIGFFIFASIAFNFKLSESPPLFLSNILVFSAGFLGILSIRNVIGNIFLYDSKDSFLLLFFFTISAFLSVGNINMHVVYPKLVLGIFTYYSFSRLFFYRNISLNKILFFFTISTAISPIFQVSLASLNEISNHSRIEVDNLGNFNAYGFLISQSLIISCYLYQQIKQKYFRLAFLLLQLPVVFVLLYTFSRGALFSSIFGAIIFFSTSRSVNQIRVLLLFSIFIIGVIFILQQLDIAEAFKDRFLNSDDNYDSGRLIIYSILLDNLLSSGFNFFFGFGLGAINIRIFIESDIQSAHNTFLDCFYTFGFIGLLFLFRYLYSLYRGLKLLPSSPEKSLILALYGQIVLSFFYDSYWGATQIGWLIPFVFAIISSFIRRNKLITSK